MYDCDAQNTQEAEGAKGKFPGAIKTNILLWFSLPDTKTGTEIGTGSVFPPDAASRTERFGQ